MKQITTTIIHFDEITSLAPAEVVIVKTSGAVSD